MSSNSLPWRFVAKPRRRGSNRGPQCEMTKVLLHPLSSISGLQRGASASRKAAPVASVPVAMKVQTEPAILDPLSAFIAEAGDDFEANDDHLENDEESLMLSTNKEAQQSWSKIMSETFSIATNFSGRIRIPEEMHYLLDKLKIDTEESTYRARLDLLEEGNAMKSVVRDGLTQKEFDNFVEVLNEQLLQFWQDDNRASLIKLLTQMAKLLEEPNLSSLQHYPSIFFRLTDLITYFGQLLYDRLASKCPQLRVNFALGDVSPFAQELCKSWLTKIVSIRELVPRLYLEIAFMKCYRFISGPDQTFPANFERLTRAIRGIQDSVVSSFVRAYLVYQAQQVLSSTSPALAIKISRQNYEEFLSLYKHFGAEKIQYVKGLTVHDYLSVYSPVISWLLQAQQFGLDEAQKDKILVRCLHEVDSAKHPGLLYKHIIEESTVSFIKSQVNHIAHVIAGSNGETADSEFSSEMVICAFGEAVLKCSFALTRSQKIDVLNLVWKSVARINDPSVYLRCALVWTEFTVQHLQAPEVDRVMQDIVLHVNLAKGKGPECFQHIFDILKCVLKHHVSLMGAISTGNFLPLFDQMETGYKTELAKTVMEKVIGEVTMKISDTVIISVLVHMCEILMNSINALSIQDEARQISQYISHVILMANYEDDFEQQLQFYTECRGKFAQLESVQMHLIHSVGALAITVKRQLKTPLSKKGRGFLQACCAYVFITIPSIANALSRLQMSVQAAEVAYFCHCLGQGDANVKAALVALGEIGKEENWPKDATFRQLQEQKLLEHLSSLLSLLLVVPDNPNNGVLYLTRATLNAINKFPWDESSEVKVTLFLRTLRLLAVACWDTYPYHFSGLDSNDTLYGSDCGFVSEVDSIATTILGQVLDEIQLAAAGGGERQALLSCQLFETLLSFADLEADETGLPNLALKLWRLSQNHPNACRRGQMFLATFQIDAEDQNVALLMARLRETTV